MSATEQESVFTRMINQSEETYMIYKISEKRFIYANPSFENLTNKSSEILLNNPGSLIEIIHPEDRLLANKVFKNLLRKRTSTLLDFRILRPDNSEKWVRIKVYPLLDGKRLEYLTGVMEDDSSRKSSFLNMEKVNGWKDSILEILAHDLRGPISTVSMLTSAIDQKIEGIEKQQILNWTKAIRDISERNIQLIHSLLRKESLDTIAAQINKERIDLVWEIAEVMKIYINAELETARHFEFTHSQEKIYAEIDSMKFLQIINNLVSNAIKFTNENGLIRVHIEKLEKSALVTVSDNGIGIPKNLQPMVFHKYTEAARKGQDGQETIGLGMWIVKSFTEAQGGRVWFESEENKGTKIYVEFPLGELEEMES